MSGELKLGWTGINAYGLLAGPGRVDAVLNQQVIQVQPMQIALSQGELRLAPAIDLRSEPTLYQPAGTILSEVILTEEMCEQWLKYVAPMVAESTRVQGVVGLNLTKDTMIPLSRPAAANIAGELIVQQAQVAPGPTTEPLFNIAAQISALVQGQFLPQGGGPTRLLVMPQQSVPFELKEGRVYHQGMTFYINDVMIRTSGSVGLDQSMDLIAQIPLKDSWLQQQPWLRGIPNQMIQVPIKGSLNKPQANMKILKDLAPNVIGGAAEGILQNELEKGLQKLFGN